MSATEEKPSREHGTMVLTRGGPMSIDDYQKQIVEQTYRINRLHIAASLLGGQHSWSDIVINDVLATAEKLMEANEKRKVVMP